MSKKSPFAECHGELYVTGAVHFLCLSVDGIPISRFGKDPRPFITVPEAIKWHREELQESCGRSGNKKLMNKLVQIYDSFKQEKIKEIDP